MSRFIFKADWASYLSVNTVQLDSTRKGNTADTLPMKTAFLALALALLIISVTSRSPFKERLIRKYLNDLEKRRICDKGKCFRDCMFRSTESSCTKKCCDDCYDECMRSGIKSDYVCRNECGL
ncbi:uncharacterized protein LOC111334587 [Stylophora pistillata]|uniref:uncharacterized protein LOC111334587 n=1 Tax=Stylophora pistillata TaxID=50429 RepID=UPI000C038B7A|nr:uncharacterized protein LOC111334587 [Stylophora pistillata]